MAEKGFKRQADEIRPRETGRGRCMATDHVTVEGCRVGHMDRELPDGDFDNGWRFFSGLESDEYASTRQTLRSTMSTRSPTMTRR
jgi:hypothetical protein